MACLSGDQRRPGFTHIDVYANSMAGGVDRIDG